VAETRVEGLVGMVRFRPAGGWPLAVSFEDRDEWYQLDGAAFFINGRQVPKAEVLAWLMACFVGSALPHAALTGWWRADAYGRHCERAEFTSGTAVARPNESTDAGGESL
jgi:hypothetical protein